MYIDNEDFPGCCGATVLRDFGGETCDCGDKECTESKPPIVNVKDIKREIAKIKGKLILAITNQKQHLVGDNLVQAGFKAQTQWINKNSGNTLILYSYYAK